ncbi:MULTISPECIES: LPS-assembly protein LptD [Thalassospira]|uniref:LPS-assembly protein LptD n=1 Tax=Thalassospira profundimaris TaxID=502049 RepID=A0A367V719_9PROT|nr:MULTISPECIES: LPS assembly protein LptD [Thalassospira]KZB70376.1 organic solvent tolerance protein [Thalassospira sp. MCCC 1A01148]RCK20985.1 organic solvent tolerance protein [Thalassospira profundimaris]
MVMAGGMIKRLATGTILGCGIFIGGGLANMYPAMAQTTDPEVRQPAPAILFSADEVDYNQDLQTVTARGNVEISREGRILLADTVSYDRSQDVLTASGNVSITEPSGEVTFASHVELSGDFKEGIVEDIYVLLDENTRIAGSGARRSGGNFTEIAKAVYSPCKVCEDNGGNSTPLWRIRAARVLHDANAKTVEYKDARLEVAGVPILYSPYFQHPDPTVKRQSGLLAPSFGSTSHVGSYFSQPYYWAIDKSKDMTFTPTYTTDEGPLLATEYRQRFDSGELEFVGSVTNDNEDKWKGHIDAEGRFDIDRTWRWGFDAEQATEKTYLSRYGFASPSVLTSNMFTEGFRGASYTRADAYYFQGLKSDDDRDTTPLVLPHMQFHGQSSPAKYGSVTTLDLDALSLTRKEGANSHRVSAKAGWELPHVGTMGDVTKLSLSVRSDNYIVSDVSRTGKSDYDGYAGRILPLAAIDWQMPFVSNQGAYHQVITPMVMAAWSPNGGNHDEIPNEDSQSFEFDDINLFAHDRFGGLDRAEDGFRASYGLEWGVYGPGGGYTSAMVGQSYRENANDTFAVGSGLEEHLSDYVGRLTVSPNRYLDLTYRYRLDNDDLSARRNQVILDAGSVDTLRINTSYVHFTDDAGSEEFDEREELYFQAERQFNQFWSGRAYGRYDIDQSDPLEYGVGFVYEDECFIFDGRIRRTFYQDQDLGESDEFLFRLVFKTLGEFASAAGL